VHIGLPRGAMLGLRCLRHYQLPFPVLFQGAMLDLMHATREPRRRIIENQFDVEGGSVDLPAGHLTEDIALP
jgi:hypothetical protein